MNTTVIVFEYNGSDVVTASFAASLPARQLLATVQQIARDKETDVSEISIRFAVKGDACDDLLAEMHPHGRHPGCQSIHQGPCYGELWQCAACGKTVCCAEGTDNHPELCDDCWAERFAPKVDAQDVAFTAEDTLTLVCDCPEQCGAWLELSPEGILALEDKDGLRVSILLPDWLDDAMHTALAAHAPDADASDVIGATSQTAWPVPTAAEPDLDTLAAWIDEGVCEATDSCPCEPDGTCAHGHPSWLLKLGLI